MSWVPACLISFSLTALWPVLVAAQQMTAEDIFNESAKAHSQYALGFSYAFGADAPLVMTAGPTTKRGSQAVAKDAAWHVGSITKSFTATLVMQLVDKGALNLDTPIVTYLAPYKDSMHPDWQAVSLRQLLSHTAGLPANAPRKIIKEAYNLDPIVGRQAVLSAMWDEPLPGKRGEFVYSNIGYVLAGLAVETVTGESWETNILTEIREPLGLTSLGFGAPTQINAAKGHRSFLGFKRPVPPEDPASDNPRWMGPAGTVHLSLTDLVKWGQMHLQACAGKIPDYLTQKSCQTMQTPVSIDYGLGWIIQSTGTNRTFIWHNGSNSLWYAVLSFVPEDDLVLAVTTNTYAPDRTDALVRKLTTALMDSRE